jgi:hypothetical protein
MFKESRNRFQGIDSASLCSFAGTSNKVVVPARQARNRFPGSLKILQIRAQGGVEGGARPHLFSTAAFWTDI